MEKHMVRLRGMPIPSVLALTACVTINVYFPAAEARDAAKEFVDKVIGEDAQPSTPAPARDEPAGDGDGGGLALRFAPLMLLGLGPAPAQGKPDISLKTPPIQAIQARMPGRVDRSLRAHFDSCPLGSTGNAALAGSPHQPHRQNAI